MKKNDTLAERAKKAREVSGLSYERTAIKLAQVVPESHAVSYGTIRRLEDGEITEDKADRVLLAGLAEVWGVPLDELSPGAVEDLAQIVEVAQRVSNWNRKRGKAIPLPPYRESDQQVA